MLTNVMNYTIQATNFCDAEAFSRFLVISPNWNRGNTISLDHHPHITISKRFLLVADSQSIYHIIPTPSSGVVFPESDTFGPDPP